VRHLTRRVHIAERTLASAPRSTHFSACVLCLEHAASDTYVLSDAYALSGAHAPNDVHVPKDVHAHAQSHVQAPKTLLYCQSNKGHQYLLDH